VCGECSYEENRKGSFIFTGSMNFTHPDFAMTWRMASIHTGPSRFYYSYGRGKTWQGPYEVPDFGTKGIAARTDYLVNRRTFARCSFTGRAAPPSGSRPGAAKMMGSPGNSSPSPWRARAAAIRQAL
jgi:hypothetical protein